MSHLILKQIAAECRQATVRDVLARQKREYADMDPTELQSKLQLCRFRVALRKQELAKLSLTSHLRLIAQTALDCARAEQQAIAELLLLTVPNSM
jgi:hypothetical protein